MVARAIAALHACSLVHTNSRAREDALGLVPDDHLSIQDASLSAELLLHHQVEHIVGGPLTMVDGPAADVLAHAALPVQLNSLACALKAVGSAACGKLRAC